MADSAQTRAGDPAAELRASVDATIESTHAGAEISATPTLERPPKPELGDYSTNAAMLLAPVAGAPPREVAEGLAAALRDRLSEDAEKVEVAGPGFINLFMSDRWYRRAVTALAAAGEQIGRPAPPDSPQRILVEFVSANPTGPLTAASGRHAAYGDALARLLTYCGHEVEREYYLNDTGGQMRRFGESIAARMSGGEPPEDGYRGEYVAEIAERSVADGLSMEDPEALAATGAKLMAESARETLRRFGVEFDSWTSERSLHERGAIGETLTRLRDAGHTYESAGATWLRTTHFGDDKDRVLMRESGEPTYFMADLAYHSDKLSRGHELLVNVLGADHHGYVSRLHAGLEALGEPRERLEVALMQLVHIVQRGARAQMSKRKGDFVTLDELISDIGTDVARFFMLQRSHDTALDLDLDLARETSNDNPVYYVQYAHARISSILRRALAEGAGSGEAAVEGRVEPAEREMIKRLCSLSSEISDAAERRAPHRLGAYAVALAGDFHAFYRDCQVIGAEGPGVERARLELCEATRRALARALGLLGVSAPERM